ncbi:hypothetical protein [Neobacillus terrae]|uniref:hypothetical protein n=1 Tax=Neobacillus terrae TaxID=3034837 RepID=UPI00140A4745|nr:hypothetical protein [Neobacillus terrae]NHM30931.1 hypothetical protein [Neobacillus terrae]
MIQKSNLHILNGQEMYNHFQQINFLNQQLMVPFNEAMCCGETCNTIFSSEFNKIRAKVHQVTPAQYNDITLKPLQPLFCKNFTHLSLWFDTDMFCQINLLTILAWLDQNKYHDSIDLKLIGDNYKPESSFTLRAEGYYSLYKHVLIEKFIPENIELQPLKKGIELYLNYLTKDSKLILYIQKHKEVPERKLVAALLKEFKDDYGLGDTQYFEIVRALRQNSN